MICLVALFFMSAFVPGTESICRTETAEAASRSAKTAQAKKIKLNKTSLKLKDGGKYTLKLAGVKASKVKWSTSNKKIVTVRKGKITAKNPGTAYITARFGGKSRRCRVKVTAYGIYPKKVTLKKGQSVTLSVKGISGTRRWFSWDPSVASVNKNGKVTAKGAGKVLVCATVGKTTFEVSVTVKKTPKKSKYTYEVYTLDKYDGNFYAGIVKPVFIKTNNPDRDSICLDSPDGDMVHSSIANLTDPDAFPYADLPMTGAESVPGGYIISETFDSPGVYTVNLYEKMGKDDPDSVHGTVVKTFTVHVLGGDEMESKWEDEMIQKYTTAAMTPVEKMTALCGNLGPYDGSGYFKYMDTRDGKLIMLAANAGLPYFIVHQIDSYMSPAMLCNLAEKIGGLSDIHNCYDDYARGTAEWTANHYKMTCVYQGQKYEFSACPGFDTNNHTSIEMIDLNDASRLHRLS